MSEKKIESYGFGRVNLFLVCISVLLIIIGYVLLSGGASDDGVSFNADTFSPTRIRIAPVVLTIGYVGLLPAVLWRQRRRGTTKQGAESKEN